MTGWDDPRNAELYDRFARGHDLYRETSRDLVRLVDPAGARQVVDLACGTGVTTEAILERAAPSARVVAIDGSEAMLALARRAVRDARVSWVGGPVAGFGRHAAEADAVVCNAAIWHLDAEATLRAAAQALRPGGRMAFNVGRGLLRIPRGPRDAEEASPSLRDLVRAIAVSDHGYDPPGRSATPGVPRSVDGVLAMLVASGLEPLEVRCLSYDTSPESDLAWLSVPVFAEAALPGLAPETQGEIIMQAYERVDRTRRQRSDWVAFLAARPAV